MRCEIIHPDFKIDLTGKRLSVVEENSWFNDQFFVKYSYPFTFDITPELDKKMRMLSELQRQQRVVIYDVVFYIEGESKEAIFVIEGFQGKEGNGKVSYGLEELPNWNTKLADLPLIKEGVTGDFYAFAKAIALQSYPDVNYNFPKIIPPEGVLDVETDRWQAFEGFINNYRSGDFVQNSFDTEENRELNKNVMQPMPYVMYLIKTAFEDAGYTLAGDILNDATLLNTLVVKLSEFYQSSSTTAIELTKNGGEYDTIENNNELGFYTESYTFTEPGRYAINGSAYIRTIIEGEVGRSIILYKNDLIFEENNLGSFWSRNYNEKFYQVETVIDVFQEDIGEAIEFSSRQYPFARGANNEIIEDPIILDVTISKIASYDLNNVAQTTLNVPEGIKLSECVPDLEFSKLFKAVRNLKNYDLTISGAVATVNSIQKEMNNLKGVNLTRFESKDPPVKFNSDESFVLKYPTIESDYFKNKTLYIDATGISSNALRDDSSIEITIDLIPLPHKELSQERTAIMIEEGGDKLQLAQFQGLVNDNNLALETGDFELSKIYNENYREWFNFRITTQELEEKFSCTPEFARNLGVYKKKYMHKGYYLPVMITKNIVNKDRVDVVIKAKKL